MTANYINWTDVRQRLEQAIELLTTRRIRDGYEFDEELGKEALASCGPDKELDGLFELSWQSGIPLNWLMLGDIDALICASAAGAQSRQEGPAVELAVSGR